MQRHICEIREVTWFMCHNNNLFLVCLEVNNEKPEKLETLFCCSTVCQLRTKWSTSQPCKDDSPVNLLILKNIPLNFKQGTFLWRSRMLNCEYYILNHNTNYSMLNFKILVCITLYVWCPILINANPEILLSIKSYNLFYEWFSIPVRSQNLAKL